MSLRTGTAARAVLRFGPDLLAVADGSEADIVRLDDAGTTIALRRGRLGVRLSEHDSGRDVEITLPIGTLRLSAPGEYDIVAGDGKSPARVAVPAGTARFSGQRARCRRRERRGGAAERRRSRHDLSHRRAAPRKTDSSNGGGRRSAIRSMRRCFAMSRPRSPATRCSTSMAPGKASPVSARCGFRRTCRATGCHTDTGAGAGSARGDGPGSTICHGVSRPRISAAGPISAGPMPRPGAGGGSRESA